MESIVTTVAAIYAFVIAHAAEILGIWVLLEQLIAANPDMTEDERAAIIQKEFFGE